MSERLASARPEALAVPLPSRPRAFLTLLAGPVPRGARPARALPAALAALALALAPLPLAPPAIAPLSGAGAGSAAWAQGVREVYRLQGGAPRELTLAEAVEIGLEENAEVRAARFRADATRAGVMAAYGRLLPQVALTGFLQRSGRGQFVLGGVPFASPPSYTTFYQLGVTHRLLDAGRDLLRLDQANAERRASSARIEEERLRTRAEIQRQYVFGLAARALADQARREIAARSTRLELAQTRFELGAVTRSDVLQARIGVSQAEVDRLTRANELRSAKLELLEAMGVEATPDSVELVERLVVFEPTLDPEAVVREALASHPALTRLRAAREQAASEHWIAKSSYLPTLEAGLFFENSAADTGAFRLSDFEDRTTYSVAFSWELFGGFQRYDLTSRARAELRAAEEAVRAGELAVEAAVRQAHLALVTAYAAQQARAESVQLARQELALAEERYRIGALSFPDLQDSQVIFTATETDFIRSTFDFFVALADLGEASGRTLFPAAQPATATTSPPDPALGEPASPAPAGDDGRGRRP